MNRIVHVVILSLLMSSGSQDASADKKDPLILEEDWQVLLKRKTWTREETIDKTKFTVTIEFASTTEKATDSKTRMSGRYMTVTTKEVATGPKPSQMEQKRSFNRFVMKVSGKHRQLVFGADRPKQDLVRNYRIDGGKLILAAPPTEPKEMRHYLVGEFLGAAK